MYNAYTDGGSRNGQHAACAWIITDQDNSILHMNSTYLGACSNNSAEYYGLIFCLTSALAGGVKELTIYQDSELVSRQMTGQYQVKAEHLKPLYLTAQHLMQKFDKISFISVPREHPFIKQCDAAADLVLDAYIKK